MAVAKRKHANELASAEKENHPPKIAKRKVSIAGLYDPRNRKRVDTSDRHLLAPRSARIYKPTVPRSFFAQFGKSKKAEQHPVYRDFKEATHAYKQGAVETKAGQLEPICDELLALVDGLPLHGQPAGSNDTLSKVAIENILREEAKFAKPLEDETLMMRCHDRSGKSYEREVKLGETMQKFEKLVEKKRSELKSLLEELGNVDDEIAVARRDIVNVERVEGGKLRRQFHSDMDALAKTALEAKERTVAHVAQARKAERAAADDEKRNLQELFGSLL